MARLDFLPKSASLRSILNAAALAAVFGLLSACGGGSTAPAATVNTQTPAQNPTPPDPATVTGVAMPQNVSVVTANNAD